MGERLKTDVISDFADTPVSVEQQRLGLFDPHPGEIIGEGQASSTLEQFAKIKCAGVHRLGDGGETEGVVLVPGDELFRAGYGNRFVSEFSSAIWLLRIDKCRPKISKSRRIARYCFLLSTLVWK